MRDYARERMKEMTEDTEPMGPEPGTIEISRHAVELAGVSLRDSVEAVLEQDAMIQELMSKAMVKDQHYGVIPGTGTKPSLLKPGAEALTRLFRLAPKYRVTETRLDGVYGEHFRLDIVCALYHRVTGEFWGEGLATISTMESKYRWRHEDKVVEGTIPDRYWKGRDQKLIGGPGRSIKKIDGAWRIVARGERIENPDIADVWNTVKKMGAKRAFVAAILTATGASTVFTQDIEEAGKTEQEAPESDAPAKEASLKAPTGPPQAQEGASKPKQDSGDWDGSKEVFFGKYSKPPEGPKMWAELPLKYLDWVIENMDAKKGPANKMAQMELARRTLEESYEGNDEPEQGSLPSEDSELEERFS